MVIMVLEDGETWTDVRGCKMIFIHDDFEESVDLDHIIKAIASNDTDSLTEYGESVDPDRIGFILTEFK